MIRPRSSTLVLGAWSVVVAILVAVVVPSAGRRASWAAEAESAAASISSRELRAVVEFLASDALQGRATGHPSNETALRYLASMLQMHGIEPAGRDGYLEPLDLLTPTLGSLNSLVVREGANGSESVTRHEVGDQVQPAAASATDEVSGPLAFAGYGVVNPAAGIDDYAGLDVRGRILVIFDRPPSGAPSTRRATLRERGEAAKARGAIGLVVVAASGERKLRDLARAFPPEPSPRDRRFLLETDLLPLPAVRVSGSLAERLLSTPGHDVSLDALRAALDSHAKDKAGPRSFQVPGRSVTLSVDVRHAPVRSFNVVGVLPGSRLPREAVVVGAHMDHDGLDADGQIYNGADDNASGTAGVLEVAQAFALAASRGARPDRSVVFALWNAEERGLLGARGFVARPRPEGARVVANLNMDMIGRDEDVPEGTNGFRGLPGTRALENTNSVHVLGYSVAPDLATLARDENAAVGLRLKMLLDDNPQDLLRRSDHWPFLERRIPALFFFTGLHPDYHTPQDDAGRLNYEKMEKIVRLVYRVAWRVANEPAPPAYVDWTPTAGQ